MSFICFHSYLIFSLRMTSSEADLVPMQNSMFFKPFPRRVFICPTYECRRDIQRYIVRDYLHKSYISSRMQSREAVPVMLLQLSGNLPRSVCH